MKSEFQRQLEALGFQKTENTPKKPNKKKAKAKTKKKKPTSLPLKDDKDKRFRKRQVINKPKLSDLEAKKTLESLHSDTQSWGSISFSRAYKHLTGRKQIPTYEQAQNTVRRWYQLDTRVYELDYSIAMYIISGIWVAPKPKPKSGMSKQVKARCERRDINGSYNVWVYKN
ncbi:hypothetical protein AB3D27_001675 [Vibrio alginolyticus]